MAFIVVVASSKYNNILCTVRERTQHGTNSAGVANTLTPGGGGKSGLRQYPSTIFSQNIEIFLLIWNQSFLFFQNYPFWAFLVSKTYIFIHVKKTSIKSLCSLAARRGDRGQALADASAKNASGFFTCSL